MSTTAETTPSTGFFGHPRGLANLFGVEMWERFSFYGMQAILLYYLYFSLAEGGLGIDKGVATGIVGAYGGAVYLATIAGSWVSDRLLGAERTLFYSGVLVLFGHVSLAVLPGATGVAVGCVLVAIGGGGIKATATALVGQLYEEGDERRDSGFSLFYMGINIGALFGPIACGILQDRVGFHYGFGVAAVGMAAGLIQYTLGRKNLPESGRQIRSPLSTMERVRSIALVAAGVAVIVLAVVFGWLNAENLADVVTTLIAVAAVILFVLILASRKIDGTERRRVFAFIPLWLASLGFWSLFQQQFTVLPIYAEERVARTVLGFDVPAAWFNSVEPLFVVLLAPVFAVLWLKLGRRQPSTPVKFALGVAGMGVAFLIMAWLGAYQGENVVNPLLLVLVLVVFVLAEMCLSPVGLSVSTKLAPRAFSAQMVALFYLTIAAGSSIAGQLAKYYTPAGEPGYFGILGGAAIALGVLLLLIRPFVRKLMGAVR